MQNSTLVLESQVDWLTVAYHGRAKTDYLGGVASSLVLAETDEGNDVRPFDLNGYVGWRVGRVRYGERESAGLLQLSGQLASDHFDELVPEASTISRLDLAVTVLPTPIDPGYGADLYECFCAYHSEHQTSALPWRVQDAHGGQTVYLGARTGDQFFRCYDKEQESRASGDTKAFPRYIGTWRHELELHDDAARVVARSLHAERDRAAGVNGMVYSYVRAHGGQPDWNAAERPLLEAGFRRRSDRDSRLRWFRKQVAPALARELQRGNPHEVWRSLGLDEPPAGMD